MQIQTETHRSEKYVAFEGGINQKQTHLNFFLKRMRTQGRITEAAGLARPLHPRPWHSYPAKRNKH